MPAPNTVTGTTTTGPRVLLTDTVDLVTLTGGRIATMLNFSGGRIYIQFDPPVIDGTIPELTDAGVYAIPQGNHRVFRRPAQSRSIVALVWGALNEYTLESEPA